MQFRLIKNESDFSQVNQQPEQSEQALIATKS